MISDINAVFPAWVAILFYTILGFVFGSFTNVLIARIPEKESINTRSRCPKCGVEIRWYDNVPILAWFYLKGKCRNCDQKISWIYPAVEFFTGMMWLLITVVTGAHLIPSIFVLGLYALMVVTVALAMIDFQTLTLPNRLVVAFAIIAVVAVAGQTLYETLHTGVFPAYNVLAALGSCAVYEALYFGLWFLSYGKWLGFGDVKLVPALGLVAGFFGVASAIIGFFAPFLIAGIPIAALMLIGVLKRKTKVPFGPFLLAGMWVAVLFHEPITEWYTGFLI